MTENDRKHLRNAYVATQEELQIIDAAMVCIDAGEIASDSEVEAAFARFRRKA